MTVRNHNILLSGTIYPELMYAMGNFTSNDTYVNLQSKMDELIGVVDYFQVGATHMRHSQGARSVVR